MNNLVDNIGIIKEAFADWEKADKKIPKDIKKIYVGVHGAEEDGLGADWGILLDTDMSVNFYVKIEFISIVLGCLVADGMHVFLVRGKSCRAEGTKGSRKEASRRGATAAGYSVRRHLGHGRGRDLGQWRCPVLDRPLGRGQYHHGFLRWRRGADGPRAAPIS